jgi:murein DD-endopeptidase MepM/ murein hydrolase activator NlpD
MKRKRIIRYTLLSLLILLIIGYCIPQDLAMPVKGATRRSFDQKSFWAYPWGTSVTHKGVDIFARAGTDVNASTGGLVVFTGKFTKGGNAVIVLGPKWRFHYYAHLSKIEASRWSFVDAGEKLGTVGTTGNAAGKPPHLHYSISSMLPLPWRMDVSHQGWKKMWYLNPIEYLNAAN